MGSFAPGKTLFAHWVLALAKMLVLTSCAAAKMLFLASSPLKKDVFENSLQRDVQIAYNTCSRARYLCEPAFHLFISSPWPPFCLLLYGDDVDAQHFGSWNTILLPNVGLLHHFFPPASHWLRADSSPSVCYASFPTGPLSPHLEGCLCLVSNSSHQHLTPLGLRCSSMQWRTQWEKPHGNAFIVSFSDLRGQSQEAESF